MDPSPVQPCFSFYRGPGEGAEPTIVADAPLRPDPQLLWGIRDWTTPDGPPTGPGHRRERAEAWSCFPFGPYYLVVRLAVPATGDGGDASFVHGRAWPLDRCSAAFDPGLYLGRPEAFPETPPDPEKRDPRTLAAPGIEPLDPILARKGLAASLIAHLFAGMASGCPTILAVPARELAGGSPIPPLVSFARGALPARLRQRCRVRIHTRSPGRFLGPASSADGAATRADLLVLDETLAAAALAAAGRQAILLDSRGERSAGPEPPEGLHLYARSAVEYAERFPAHLTAFGERFDRLWPVGEPLPGPDLTGWTTLTYRLAAALAGSESQRGGLLAGDLLAQAKVHPDLPWSALIRPEDWACFPLDHRIRLVLRADDDLSEGERHLREALAAALGALGAKVDAGLAAWWDPADRDKRRRLIELCGSQPPLISPERCAALISSLPMDRLIADGLFDARGGLRLEPAPWLAVRLLEHAALAERLSPRDLVRLGEVLPEDATGALAAYYGRADTLMREEPEATTTALIEGGTWLSWRRQAQGRLDGEALRACALAWLTSPALADLREPGARERPPQWRAHRSARPDSPCVDVDLETWHQVLEDLGTLALDDIRALSRPETHWPWIHPFQQRQVTDLDRRCTSPEARAELARICRAADPLEPPASTPIRSLASTPAYPPPSDGSTGAMDERLAPLLDPAHLDDLAEHLARLPADSRARLLDALRGPVARWEHGGGPGPDPAGPADANQRTGAVSIRGPWPWVLAGLCVLNLVGLAVIAWQLIQLQDELSAQSRYSFAERLFLNPPGEPTPSLRPPLGPLDGPSPTAKGGPGAAEGKSGTPTERQP